MSEQTYQKDIHIKILKDDVEVEYFTHCNFLFRDWRVILEMLQFFNQDVKIWIENKWKLTITDRCILSLENNKHCIVDIDKHGYSDIKNALLGIPQTFKYLKVENFQMTYYLRRDSQDNPTNYYIEKLKRAGVCNSEQIRYFVESKDNTYGYLNVVDGSYPIIIIKN